MKNYFKPEHFEIQIGDNREIHEIANEVLQELVESWPVVYGVNYCTAWTATPFDIDTHKARLAFIEEIKKEPCKHEPEETLGRLCYIPICKHCGVELQATWTEVKP